MNPLAWLGKQLDDGWFSRALVVAQFYIAWNATSWAQSYASTALAAIVQGAADGKSVAIDLTALSLNIGAVFLGPQALLFAATKFYMDARATQPRVIADRRSDP
ncbi:MAG: hypothetical protein AB7P08_17265 [Burkholderiales bacterium]